MPSDQPPEPTNPEPTNLELTNPEPTPELQVPPIVEESLATPLVAKVISEAEAEAAAEIPQVALNPDFPSARARPPLPPDFVDETLPETGLRLLKQALGSAQPILKAALIKLLRSSIALLETTVNRLEAEPQPPVSPANSGDIIAPADRVPAVISAPGLSESVAGAVPGRPVDSDQSIAQKARRWWGSILNQVRGRLPVSLSQKLSDPALTGAIAGVLILLFWTTSAVLPSKTKAPEVAVAPSVSTPSPQPVPPQVQAPAPPQPVPVSPTPKPKPSPSPALQLSPEQKLIASIQDQVAEVSDRYSSSLIRSVQANFRSSRLVVKLGESWYGLSETQQNKLSNELLKRAQQLDFVKLELSDPEGVLLARSPVVGSEMIILKRTTVAESEEAAEV